MSDSKKCPECSSEDNYHFNPFGFGDLLDEHMDIEVEESELNRRYQEAIRMSKLLGGNISSGLEDELGELIKPRLTWQDFIRHAKFKIKTGSIKNNWNSPKRKLLFSGLYVPKKIEYSVKFLMAYDCSGSMKKEDIIYGISQIQALDSNGEGWCLPWDSVPHFDAAVKIRKANPSELKNAKYKGGGGTRLMPVFTGYEKHFGKVDIIVIISDFELSDLKEINNMKKIDNTSVIWINVGKGNTKFEPPFGRLFNLSNEL